MTEHILEAAGMLLGGLMAFKMGQDWEEFRAVMARRRRRTVRRHQQRMQDRLGKHGKDD